MTDTRRRVKLYALNAERQWDDKGTGHVSSNYVERLKGISLLVRAEADGKHFYSIFNLKIPCIYSSFLLPNVINDWVVVYHMRHLLERKLLFLLNYLYCDFSRINT